MTAWIGFLRARCTGQWAASRDAANGKERQRFRARSPGGRPEVRKNAQEMIDPLDKVRTGFGPFQKADGRQPFLSRGLSQRLTCFVKAPCSWAKGDASAIVLAWPRFNPHFLNIATTQAIVKKNRSP
jgi:hypothetical protein